MNDIKGNLKLQRLVILTQCKEDLILQKMLSHLYNSWFSKRICICLEKIKNYMSDDIENCN